MAEFISVVSGLINAGNSISSVTSNFLNSQYNVTFKLVVENYSNYFLLPHENYNFYGEICEPQIPIKPGYKEAMSGHKIGNTATGCSGTVSWKIGESNKMFVIMFSVPYNQDFYKNKIGIGIFPVSNTESFFQSMYYGKEINFQRKQFFHDTNSIKYEDQDFIVYGNMGSAHKPSIEIQFFPKTKENLAESFRNMNIFKI